MTTRPVYDRQAKEGQSQTSTWGKCSEFHSASSSFPFFIDEDDPGLPTLLR
ncbi:hypothetical protein [Schaalia sp. ZJ1691]|uniref:hypothetical protein n=1 Tax=Schaalia sp. ZJ1691 TaxID=2709404 RepID=UPI0013E9EC54|nr:hypothetical protein [Schaalia sp. ZJ1691]